MKKSLGIISGLACALILGGCSAGKNIAPAAPTFTLEGVNFATDSASLTGAGKQTLDNAATALKQHSGTAYEVAGYTDSRGSAAYNQGLSERRANSVKSYLVGADVPSSQLSAHGYGESNPVASNDTAAGRAANRRVEIRPN